MARKKRGIKVNQKFTLILFAFMAVLLVLFGRVAYFKIVHGAEFEQAVKNQQINRYDLINAANRGSILDRNEQVLAVSTAVYNVVLDPLQLYEENDPEETEKTFTTLCEYFPELKKEDLQYHITLNASTNKINTPTHWKYLVKGVERSLKEEMEEKDLLGVYFEQTSKRSYPLKTLACHLIGFNNTWGLEGYYNEEMTGVPGRSFILYQGADTVTYQDYAASDGSTIVTTLDYTIQQYAEEAVAETMQQWPSENVSSLVMNPNTGEIYAMASANKFDLNDPDEPLALSDETFAEEWNAMTEEEQSTYLNNMWRNFCISDTWEPGSVYKPLVVAAALEEGVITKSSTFYCSGSITVADRQIGCHLKSGHGVVTVEDIMAQSCNPGIIQIAQKLGAEKMYKYQREFGFGQKTGIDLPGEAEGLLHSKSAIGPTELATIAFGQTFNSTAMQTATAFSSLINGGNLVQPYVVSQIIDNDGAVVMEQDTEVVRKVISQKTSDYIRTALKATVDHGTAKKIAIPGYSIGCKTGTAEQGNRARNDLWTLTHLAYFPAENPQYLVFSIIHLPDDYADGVQTTATMTKQLMENIIKYKNLEPTETTSETATLTQNKTVKMPDYIGSSTYHVTMDLEGRGLNYKVVGTGNTITNQVPKSGTEVEVGSEVILYVAKSEDDSGAKKVPNVVGKSYTEAVSTLQGDGFEVVFEGEIGNSIVSAQDPKHGVSVSEGSEVKIILTKKESDTTDSTE
ncbi:MAG: PASTA domain-containing protein [Anaerotignum sp.]|nr:PASTA domain-containing protein [Anaerotignum sp.]MBR6542459.1 PASTA domain-containing protein [Anaerotignum sp.]